MPIDAAQLEVALDRSEDCLRRLRVTVPAAVVASERAAAVKRYSSRIKMKGFRAGHVPADLVEKRFGDTIRSETLSRVVEEAYRSALRKTEMHPVGEASIDGVDWEDGQALSFAVEFEVRPEPVFARLGGFKLERSVRGVSAEAIGAVLERLRFQQGVWIPAEGHPQPGDLVEVRITPLEAEGGERPQPRPYQIVIGDGDALPEIEVAIQTLEPGGSGEFTVGVPDDFADDFASDFGSDFASEERQGTQLQLLIELDARKVREIPELDDVFASSLGSFESLAALRDRVEEDLRREADEEAESRLRGQLLDFILEANPFPVPRSMVDGYIDSLLGDVGEADPRRVAETREQLRPGAERAVKRFVALDQIALNHDLAASEDEVGARIREIAEKNGQDPARVAGRLKKAGRFEGLAREITEGKVFAFLKEQSEIIQER